MTEINGYQQSDDENHIEVVDLPTLGGRSSKSYSNRRLWLHIGGIRK